LHLQKRYQAKDAASEEQQNNETQLQQGGFIRTAPDLEPIEECAQGGVELTSQHAEDPACSTSGVWFSRSNRNRVQPTRPASTTSCEEESVVDVPSEQREIEPQGNASHIPGISNNTDVQQPNTLVSSLPKQPTTVVPPLSLPVRPSDVNSANTGRTNSTHATPRSGRLAPLPAPHGPAVNSNSNRGEKTLPSAVPALGLAGLAVLQNALQPSANSIESTTTDEVSTSAEACDSSVLN
jgi:hypothetical protein